MTTRQLALSIIDAIASYQGYEPVSRDASGIAAVDVVEAVLKRAGGPYPLSDDLIVEMAQQLNALRPALAEWALARDAWRLGPTPYRYSQFLEHKQACEKLRAAIPAEWLGEPDLYIERDLAERAR